MRIICIILCVGLIMGLGYVVIRKIKKYPDEVEYSSLRAFADDGMYYIKRNVLYFLDSKTEKSVVVCNKANCKHNTENCNAYIFGLGSSMLYY